MQCKPSPRSFFSTITSFVMALTAFSKVPARNLRTCRTLLTKRVAVIEDAALFEVALVISVATSLCCVLKAISMSFEDLASLNIFVDTLRIY